jgi:hypothetical protein
MRSFVTVAFGVLVSLAVVPARAVDELVPGRVVTIRVGKLVRVVAKPIVGGTFTLPGNSPTGTGGSLDVFDTSGPAGADTYDLPAAGWSALGPAGASGYRYRGEGTPSDPCTMVLVKQRGIKALCKGSGMTLTPPFSGNVGAVLTFGTDHYCAQFGGIIVKNDDVLTKRKDAPAPAQCPAPLAPPYCFEGPFPACGGGCPVGSVCFAHPTLGCVCMDN